MGVTTTTALILRHQDDREHDRVILALTPEQGLLRLRARGSKRSAAKLAGSLEPLTEVTLSFADGRVSGLITGAIIRNRHAALRTDLLALVSAQWLAELVEHVARPGQTSTELWSFVQASLAELAGGLEESDGRRWLKLDRLAFRLLQLEGFVPALDHCPRCPRPMPAGPIAYEPLVGFVHPDEGSTFALKLSAATVQYLAEDGFVPNERTIFRELHAIVESLITHTIDRPLKSQRVLRSVFRHSRLSAAGE